MPVFQTGMLPQGLDVHQQLEDFTGSSQGRSQTVSQEQVNTVTPANTAGHHNGRAHFYPGLPLCTKPTLVTAPVGGCC